MSPRSPAPGRLEVLRGFVNSFDVERDDDALSSPAAAAKWLLGNDLLSPGEALDAGGLQRLRRTREAFRALLLTNAGDALDPEAVAVLSRESEAVSLTLGFDDRGRTALGSARAGVDGTIAKLLAIVHDTTIEGTWSRLKACRNDECRWAFYDHSKNHSGRWCTMDVCGNVMKARAYRRRARGAARP